MRSSLSWALFVATVLVAGCSRPVEPEFRGLDNVVLQSARLDGTLVLSADAVFHNPNDFGLTVTGLDVDISVNEHAAATVRQDSSTEVPATSDFALPVQIEVPLQEVFGDLGGLIGGLLAGKEQEVRLHLDGRVRVKALGVELSVPFDHEEVHTIER